MLFCILGEGSWEGTAARFDACHFEFIAMSNEALFECQCSLISNLGLTLSPTRPDNNFSSVSTLISFSFRFVLVFTLKNGRLDVISVSCDIGSIPLRLHFDFCTRTPVDYSLIPLRSGKALGSLKGRLWGKPLENCESSSIGGLERLIFQSCTSLRPFAQVHGLFDLRVCEIPIPSQEQPTNEGASYHHRQDPTRFEKVSATM